MNIQVYKWYKEKESCDDYYQFIFVYDNKIIFGIRFDGKFGNTEQCNERVGDLDMILEYPDLFNKIL